MQIMKRYILLSVVALIACVGVRAQVTQEEGTLRFSLLTCTPGTDAYAHFGHTAIRMDDTKTGLSVVYNYGCFDYSQHNFILNFVRGNTNYLLEKEMLRFFLWRYHQLGNGVTEQKLNLTADEAARLEQLLVENVRPENQTYLYSWLYDNCTERARDIIEEAVKGTDDKADVIYEKSEKTITARQMLHEKLTQAPWLRLGIDMVLGEEIDRPIDRRLQMFIPNYYEAELDSAVIVAADGTRRPLVKAKQEMLAPSPENNEVASPLSPLLVFGLLLLAVVLISAWDMKRGKSSTWLDVLLHTAQGCGGIIVAYLFFFSKHPAVDSNWQVILFNPLFLCYAIWLLMCTVQSRNNVLTPVNLAVTATFIVLMLTVRQSFNPAVYLMALILLVRAIIQIKCRKTYIQNNC